MLLLSLAALDIENKEKLFDFDAYDCHIIQRYIKHKLNVVLLIRYYNIRIIQTTNVPINNVEFILL